MSKILGLLFGIKDVKFRCDDDFVDRMSRRYSVGVFLVFSIIVTTGTYVGNRIDCWCPAQFTGTHVAYANSICWIKNTYYVPISYEVDLPKHDDPNKKMINYYQWVPMILLAQALMCYFPSIVWRVLCRRSGLNVAAVMDAAIAGQRTTYADIRDKTIRYMVLQIDRYLITRLGERNGCWARVKYHAAKYCCLIYGKFYGNFLIVSYMMIKLLYLVNAIGQLYLLDLFLGVNFHFFGIEVLHKLLKGEDWSYSERFPRETMCDFQIRHMNQVHRFVLQCVLPINLFNEKIFIFIWFWLFLVSLTTVVSFVTWTIKISLWPAQVHWVKRHLKPFNNDVKFQKEVVKRFTENYLKRDGMFMLRLISCNVGNLAASEVLCGLWDNFGPERRYAGEIATGGGNKRCNEPTLPTRPAPVPTRVNMPMHRMHRVDSV
ncbi:hypothetical protein LSH36_268g02028 [Paralvinella palmiformis]|uniref:Innexin n=1 Tax=Paralvinella palmiformis TaxID=53620 RepID=A0AAD9JJR1_9ANNE|nr:hypothetical protein LSH36_268g02028 [Paralvinella palmiformis]